MRKATSNKKLIPGALYKKIVELMPICCVDAVFKSGKDVYLFKRAYEPAKDKWWIIGGRILKGETLKKAMLRKAKEEIGIDAKIVKQIGVYETFMKKTRFDKGKKKLGSHSIAVCYVIEPKRKNFKLKLNEEYKGYKIIKRINNNLHPYIKKLLKDSKLLRK